MIVNRSNVAVVIPIYKAEINYFETLSLKQCIGVLSKYQIIFIAPDNINFNVYHPFCEGVDYRIIKFENKYFQTIKDYNQLMLSSFFYKKFLSYKFILIYQLDAFVFKDALQYWCGKNYDFIGAPHASYNNDKDGMQHLKKYRDFWSFVGKTFGIKHKTSNVGNGGLSLRKTKSFYLLLKILKSRASAWPLNEDSFFEYWGNIFYPLFRLPDNQTALQFSIEQSPKEALNKLNNHLPFGCHAFEKYEWDFWKPYILDQ